MEKEQEFQLVEGTFNAHDAAEVLFTLISNKINFHKLQQFSFQERNVGDIAHSKQRIASLEKSREQVKRLIEECRNNDLHVELEGIIKIKIVDKK